MLENFGDMARKVGEFFKLNAGIRLISNSGLTVQYYRHNLHGFKCALCKVAPTVTHAPCVRSSLHGSVRSMTAGTAPFGEFKFENDTWTRLCGYQLTALGRRPHSHAWTARVIYYNLSDVSARPSPISSPPPVLSTRLPTSSHNLFS